jgi:mannose-6-phosphate isomerase-like protein (cupin superfamily)
VTSELRKGIGVFIPAEVSFTMKNTGDEPLTMYVVNEPTPANFKPKDKILVRDEMKSPIGKPTDDSPYNTPGASGHWAHLTRGLFARADGLASISGLITVTINPMTLGEPHTHEPGHEEIWAAIDGTSLAMLGAQLRVQRPGMAFMLRPDDTMLHANINYGDTPVKFLWFSGSRRADARAAEAAAARTQ